MIEQVMAPPAGRRRLWVWILVGLLVCWSGCGGDSDPRAMHYKGRWGGMSEEEWRALAEKRQKEEEEEARQAAEAAKRREEEERRKQEEEARQQVAARRKQRTSGQPANGNAPAQTNATESPADDGEEAAHQPKPKSSLPEAFDQWKPEHYLLARQQAPQRLVEAMGHLAQTRRGDPEVVELLLDVLWTDRPGAGGAPSASGRSHHSEMILRAAADVLAQQQTPKAAEALRQLLSGQAPTEDHPTCIRCVLAALAAQPTPDHDRLLLQAVLGPENLLASSAAMHVQLLQQEALRALTNQARPELQEQLARYVDQPGVAPAIRQKIEQAFIPTRWDHFQANWVLVQSPRTSASVRSAIFRQFALWSAQAAQVLSLPEGLHRPADQQAQARQAAEALWNPAFAPALQAVLSPAGMAAGGDLALEQSAAQLAMTIPASWARRLLADWLAQRWVHRPEALRKQVEQLAFEPGFLVLTARLLYEEIDPVVPLDPSAKVKPIPGKPAARTTEQEKARQQALGPVAKEWLGLWEQASAGMRGAVFQELAAGAANRPAGALTIAASDASSPSEASSPEAAAPSLSLPPQAKLLGRWEAELAARKQQLNWNIPQDSASVSFGRWQVEAAPLSLASRLERNLPKARRRAAGGAVLVESAAKMKEGDAVRMVQICIRPLQPEIPRSLQESQPLLVEVLAVQIPEPSAPASPQATTLLPPAWDFHPQKRVQKTYQDFTKSLLALNRRSVQ